MWISLVALFCIALQVGADVYLHNPRGSNNRLDERGRERANANRMFDSQNNNRGGYNVGSLYYYPGSVMNIEWTNQHSCGEANAHCELVVQYMCSAQLRDGTLTKTIPVKDSHCDNYDCNSDLEYGMNENLDYYLGCKYRERNKGLFTADQNMNNRNAAINTRQNPKGTRRAYECPEERDYYPYWGPTPWKDIAIMTNDISRCPEYQAKSANVQSRWHCQPPPGYLRARQANQARQNLPLNKDDCEDIVFAGTRGNWTEVPPFGIAAPDCLLSPSSRDNHNGNGEGGFPNNYNWTIPSDINENCALRLRYNVSTGEFASNITAALNANNNNNPTDVDIASLVGLSETEANQRGYVFEGNPTVQPLKVGNTAIGAKLQLQLAINTAQYGRTFQDRSHSFQIRARPASLEAATKIHNLNVRGKRGNIVQVYPAVEYDFVPNRLEMNTDEYVHIQWTGSNTNPENNDGQGLRGTDRSNIALLTTQNYPEGTPNVAVPEGQKNGHWGNNYPEHLNAASFLGLPKIDRLNLAILSPGQFKGELSELDDAGTYYDLGPRKITSNGTGTYHYMCTRNNNFSNRSQKGRIVVNSVPKVNAVMGWSGGQLTLGDGTEGVWVDKGVMDKPARIEISEWEEEAGEKLVESQGGKMEEGSGYESKYFVVRPFGVLANGNLVTIQMKVDSSSSDIYHSEDYKSWIEVDNVEFDDGVAKFKYHRGGIFVARSNNAKRNIIIGVVVALIIIAILVIGVVVYCRKNPDSMASARKGMNNMKLGARGKV